MSRIRANFIKYTLLVSFCSANMGLTAALHAQDRGESQHPLAFTAPITEIGPLEAEACATLSQSMDRLRREMRFEHKAAQKLAMSGTLGSDAEAKKAYDEHRINFSNALRDREVLKADFLKRNCMAPHKINYDVFKVVCKDRLGTRFCRFFKDHVTRFKAELQTSQQ